MTARKPLTRTEIILMCQNQSRGGIACGCGCGEPLDPVVEGVIDEHVIPRKLTEIGSEGERDVLTNRRFYRKPCAMRKTRDDLAVIAKARAQGGETGQAARRERRGHGSIKSAGFRKDVTKGFDGKVRPRKSSETTTPTRGGYEPKANEQ